MRCGNNSAVECNLAKVEVAGSNPVSRSNSPLLNCKLQNSNCTLVSGKSLNSGLVSRFPANNLQSAICNLQSETGRRGLADSGTVA